MNSKIISIKTTSAIFLAIVLVTGTITALSSSSSLSSFMTKVHALSDYGLENNYKKSKDSSSKSININKIKCINDNININGVNSGDINIGNKEQVAANSFENDDKKYYDDVYNNKDFICKIENENRQITLTTPPTTQPSSSPPPCEITVDTITAIGDNPLGIAYDPIHQRMYVANLQISSNSTVSVIDTTTNTVIGSPIPVGEGPAGIAYDPVNERVYVTHELEDNVYVIDTNTNSVIDIIPVGDVSNSIAYDPVNQMMYVTNYVDNTVSVIDTTTNTVVDTIPVGANPLGIAYDPVNHRMYVTNNDDETVSVINLC